MITANTAIVKIATRFNGQLLLAVEVRVDEVESVSLDIDISLVTPAAQSLKWCHSKCFFSYYVHMISDNITIFMVWNNCYV